MIDPVTPSASTNPLARRIRLRTMLGWSALGQATYVLSQFGVLSALTHFAPLHVVGRFGLAMAIASPVIMFSNLGMRIGKSTDVRNDYAFSDYLGLRIVATLLAILIIIFIGAFAFSSARGFLVISLVALMKGIETFSMLFYGCFQKRERMDLVARSLILRGPLSLVLFAMILWKTRSVPMALLGQCLIWSLVAILHDYPIAARHETCSRIRFDSRRMWCIFRSHVFLGVGSLLTSVSNSAPRLVTGWLLGLEALGLFTPFAYVMQAGMMATSSVNNALSPRLARLHEGGGVGFSRILRKACIVMTLAGISMVVLAVFIAPPVIGLVFGESFRSLSTLMVILLLALTLRMVAAVLQSALLAERRFTEFAKLRLGIAAISILFAIIGAHFWGLYGIAAATVALALVQASSLAWMLHLDVSGNISRNTQRKFS